MMKSSLLSILAACSCLKAIELVEPLLVKYPNKVNLKTFLADLYLDLAEDEKALDLLAGSVKKRMRVFFYSKQICTSLKDYLKSLKIS